ncbi:hypothetical protein E2C01_022143 [Portunus trituberculatus]|uniref:Uncharacterized protein n=1 Tax=Portunus trituberculatus TaxID=210409 RepID=A0A5B7E6U1_PORTR|nr:hypothetical protein [Portunus trituberculatus]
MIQVSRSPRGASPEQSPSGSRRSSTSSNYSHSAGLPSRQANSMADILHGRPDRHTPAARLCPRYQTTLEVGPEWMRGPSSGSETPYSRASNSYSASRTPSNTGSPLRTPWGGSPPRTQPHTPPTTSQPASRKKSADLVDGHRSTLLYDQDDFNFALLCFTPSKMGIEPACQLWESGLGKNSQWRDSVARSSATLAERMSSPTGSTMSGVLHENDSVHGHLKFHHHALWDLLSSLLDTLLVSPDRNSRCVGYFSESEKYKSKLETSAHLRLLRVFLSADQCHISDTTQTKNPTPSTSTIRDGEKKKHLHDSLHIIHHTYAWRHSRQCQGGSFSNEGLNTGGKTPCEAVISPWYHPDLCYPSIFRDQQTHLNVSFSNL